MMANGKLVRVLLHTDVVKYLEFKAVDGSYVLSKGKIHKVKLFHSSLHVAIQL
jgi:Rab GDP dissociation inhibitor